MKGRSKEGTWKSKEVIEEQGRRKETVQKQGRKKGGEDEERRGKSGGTGMAREGEEG